jgi:23S rRNA-/tRNA-specific pseudouridylate synthase
VRSLLPRSSGGGGEPPALTGRPLRLLADARHAGRRADDVAREWLTEVLGSVPSKGAVRRLIMAGALRVRGQPLRAPGRLIQRGALLDLRVRPELLLRDEEPSSLDAARILHEDDAVIAVDKPPRLPTVATADPRRPHLVGLVERLLEARARGGRPAPPATHPRWWPLDAGGLAVHQRLDQDTSGVVLFVKDPAANAGLAAQFAAHTVEKTYLALTARPARLPAPRWRVESGAAVTDFVVVEAFPRGLLVEAHPRTGRKHQIRIHLAEAGMPILGDARYGGDGAAAPRVMLHAARLRLRHPLSGAPLSIRSPVPADFQAVLDGLRPARATGRDPRRRRRGP